MKKIKLGRGINQYKRTYNKECGALLGLIAVFIIMSHGIADYGDEKYVAEVKQEIKKTPTQKESVEDKIRKYFPRSHATIIPIAYAESGMRMESINYNCYYNSKAIYKNGKLLHATSTVVYEQRVKDSYGTFCKKEHRKYAFGVDCFILQSHYPGRKTCPTDVSLDQHLKEMAELSKKRNFAPWVAWQNGSYKKYLASK